VQQFWTSKSLGFVALYGNYEPVKIKVQSYKLSGSKKIYSKAKTIKF